MCVERAERFGRKKTILIFATVKIVGILMSVFAGSYVPFVVGRFFMGCGIGSFLPTYVLSKISLTLMSDGGSIRHL